MTALGARFIDHSVASWYRARALRRRNSFLAEVGYHPTGALVGLVIILAMSGASCGPIEYINQVGVKAASAVSAAKLAQADRYAPYEYTAAEEYLHKAREEAGYAEYEDAIEFGRRAEDLANKGRAIAVTKLSQSATSSSSALSPKSENEEPKPPGAAAPEDSTGARGE
jgi:Domain of unknown function (DUF4398)